MKIYFIGLSLLVIQFLLNGQITIKPDLAVKLRDKNSFDQIWATVYNHYQTLNLDSNIVARREFKKWNRWAWWAARNIDDNGKLLNNQNEVQRAYEKIQNSKNTRSNTGAWSSVGTSSFQYLSGNIVGTGRVDRITFHPIDTNTIYIGSSGGGLWMSQNNGSSWVCLTNNLPECAVTGVAVDPNNTNNIFIATGDGDTGDNAFVNLFEFRKRSYGILKSNNNGISWNILGNSAIVMGNRLPYKLLKLRGYTDRFICATTSGFMISIDNGITWTSIQDNGSPIFDIEQDPDDDSIVFASGLNNLMKSTDGGQTFTSISSTNFSPALANCQRSAISFNISNNNELYLIQMGVNSTTNDRLYKSTDSGSSFTSVNTTNEIADEAGRYLGPLAVKGSNVLSGAVNLFRSTDSGVTFIDNTNWFANSTTNPQFIHADIHDIAFSPHNNKVYAATDGGVFRSNDEGNTWELISNGLNTLQFYHLDGIDGNVLNFENTYIGGFQDNGAALTTNSGGHLQFFGSGDGYQVKFVPTDPSIIYYVYNQSIGKFDISTNTSTNVLVLQSWFPKLSCHPTNPQIAYFGTSNNIWKTTDQGNSVSIIANFGASNNASSHAGGIATTNANSQYVYASNQNTVSKSINEGVNWTTISGNTGWLTNWTAITDIASCHGSQDILYVTTNSSSNAKVLFTQDGGNTWHNITGSLPQAAIVYSVACHNNGDAYIGTNFGIFYQGISMNDWIPYSNGLPLIAVSDLFINEDANKITASTFGRGLWYSDLYTNCEANLTLSGNVAGYNRYQASNVIQSTQNMNGNFANDISYRANSRIQLLPGFSSLNGSRFQAKIEQCGEGVFVVNKKFSSQN